MSLVSILVLKPEKIWMDCVLDIGGGRGRKTENLPIGIAAFTGTDGTSRGSVAYEYNTTYCQESEA